jgi:hypothetical protein
MNGGLFNHSVHLSSFAGVSKRILDVAQSSMRGPPSP